MLSSMHCISALLLAAGVGFAGGFGARGHHLVDEAVFQGLVGGHEVVALGVALDALQRLAGAIG